MTSEIDRLRRSVGTLTEALEEKDKQIKNKDEFIKLMEPYMVIQDSKFEVLTDDMQEIVRAYRRATQDPAV